LILLDIGAVVDKEFFPVAVLDSADNRYAQADITA
jgi:hypothetical protein